MKFSLRNLGRIEQATIDLGKDLILLAGPDTTAKMHLLQAIYGFCIRFGGAHYVTVLWEELERFTQVTSRETDDWFGFDLCAVLGAHARTFALRIAERYKTALGDVFAAEEHFVSRATVVAELEEAEIEAAREALLAAEVHRVFSGTNPLYVEKKPGSGMWMFATEPGQSLTAESRRMARMAASAFGTRRLLGALFQGLNKPYVLAAERAAILLFSQELSLRRTELVDSLLKIRGDDETSWTDTNELWALLGRSARRYPQPIRDSIRRANDLLPMKRAASPFASLADALDRELLKGSLRITEGGEMCFVPAREGPELGMHLCSFSVRSIAGLSFYLRHLAQRGQFLIIEEPECGLCPAEQRTLLRFLARLTNSGIKIMLSTQSDSILREVNTLMMLSADTDGTLRERFAYEAAELLSPAQVAAYALEDAAVRPIPIDKNGIGESFGSEDMLERRTRQIAALLFGGEAT